MLDHQTKLFIVLAMVLVTLDGTYSLTHKLFGGLLGKPNQVDYGVGMKLTQPGYYLHIIVFVLLLCLV